MPPPAVILGIQKQPGANTLTLTRALDKVLTDLQATLPDGMQMLRSCGRPTLLKWPWPTSHAPCAMGASWSWPLCSSFWPTSARPYYPDGHSPVAPDHGACPQGV